MRGSLGRLSAGDSPASPSSSANGSAHAGSRAGFAAMVVCVVLAAVVILTGELFGVSYYLTSTAVVVLAIVPFLASFEGRRPQARELVLLAVLCALAVASRVAFAAIPHVKPLIGIVIISGVAFGGRAGFLVGAMAALVSNFIFGQGPWTPWQMLAYGSAGLAAGALAKAGVIPHGAWSLPQRIGVGVLGFVLVVGLVGPILDTCSLFTMVSAVTPETAVAVYGIGFATANVPHGIATFVTLFLVGDLILRKLARMRVKYGLME